MIRRAIAGSVLLFLGACQYDLSFKSATVERATPEQAYKASLEVLRDCFYQIPIYPDQTQGQIETDYLTKPGNPTYREKVYIKIAAVGEGGVRVEVLAPIEEMDMSSPDSLKWELLGSDFKVEQLLVDRIVQRVVAPNSNAEPAGAQSPAAATDPVGPPVSADTPSPAH